MTRSIYDYQTKHGGNYSGIVTTTSNMDYFFEAVQRIYAQSLTSEVANVDSVYKVFWAIAGNLVGMILNAAIALILMLSKTLRTAQMFPILIQSILDFFSTGLIPFLANTVLVWVLTNHSNLYRVYSFVFGRREVIMEVAFYTKQKLCYVFVICDSIVKGSTGLTVTAVAFIRFLSVCYPFKLREWTQGKFYIKFFTLLLLLIAFLITGEAVYRTHIRPSCFEPDRRGVKLSYAYNPLAAMEEIDNVLFFGYIGIFFVPLFSTSVFFYVRVSLKLLQSERNASANKGITVAFILNTILWALCWGVSFIYQVC